MTAAPLDGLAHLRTTRAQFVPYPPAAVRKTLPYRTAACGKLVPDPTAAVGQTIPYHTATRG